MWMRQELAIDAMAGEQDRLLSETVGREQARLRSFIRRRVNDPGEVEDILQDVFSELVEAYRLMKPIEQVSGWLFRVARNRIVDSFRKKKPEALADHSMLTAEGDLLTLEDMLPSPDAGPDAAYARTVLVEELEEALAELPEAQRAVFIAHEIEGRSFKELAEESGVNMNTLLSRKRAAVLQLREQRQDIYDEMNRR